MCGPSFRESLDDEERSGRLSTSKTDENVDKIKEMMDKNHKWTIGEMAANLNIAYESVQDILFNDLGLREAIRQKKDRICGNPLTRGRTIPSLSATF